MMIGPWHKISAAREYLGGVSQRKIRGWVASGKLKHRRVDGVLYFATAWMDEFMLAGAEDTTKNEKVNTIVDEVMEGLR
jgi:hypothetical protein